MIVTLLLWAGLAATVSTALFLAATQPLFFKPLWFEDVLSLGFAALLAPLLAHIIRTRRLQSQGNGSRWPLVMAGIITGAITWEIYLRTMSPHRCWRIGGVGQSDDRIRDERWRLLFKPFPSPEEAADRSLQEIFMLRDYHALPKPRAKGERRVVHLGDSMTEGSQVPLHQRFTRLLEIDTKVPQYVLAIGGTGTDWALRMLERFGPLIEPTVVLLHFYPVNDFYDIGRLEPACGFNPLYVPSDSGFRLACTEYRPSAVEQLWTCPPAAWLGFMARHSCLGGVLMDNRDRAYIRLGTWLFGGKNPWSAHDVHSKRGRERVCQFVESLRATAVEIGAAFGVSLVPDYNQLVPGNNRQPYGRLPENIRATHDCLERLGISYADPERDFAAHVRRKGRLAAYLPKDDPHFSAGGHALYAASIKTYLMGLLEQAVPRAKAQAIDRH